LGQTLVPDEFIREGNRLISIKHAVLLMALVAAVFASAAYGATTRFIQTKHGDTISVGTSNIFCTAWAKAIQCAARGYDAPAGYYSVYTSQHEVLVMKALPKQDFKIVFKARF
jgi:hypothetical protein